eukprot:Pgem_evm1s7376
MSASLLAHFAQSAKPEPKGMVSRACLPSCTNFLYGEACWSSEEQPRRVPALVFLHRSPKAVGSLFPTDPGLSSCSIFSLDPSAKAARTSLPS